MSPISLKLDPQELKPLISAIVREVLDQVQADQATLNGRIAYSEREAAALLGLKDFQLRDERLKGRIAASIGPKNRILYSRQDILDYLARRRWGPG